MNKMEEYCILSVLCIILVTCSAGSDASLKRSIATTWCKDSDDCGPDQCCEFSFPRRGKRGIFFFRGVCKDLRGLGDTGCEVDSSSGQPEGLVEKCPCRSGLTCEGTGVFEIPQGEIGICTQPCNSNQGCPKGYCCVSNTRPIGKRSATSKYTGTCQKLGQTGNACLVNNMFPGGKDESFFVSCPCGPSLACSPDGGQDIPLGPTGVCTQTCDSNKDCPYGSCCVSNTRPKGKRSAPLQSRGTCQNLGQNGSGCFVNNVFPGTPDGSFFVSCPCSPPLTCGPDGGHDNPLGPTGTCQTNKQDSKEHNVGY